MTVSTIANIAAGLSRLTENAQSKPAAVIRSLVGANPDPVSTTSDVTDLVTAVTLQNQIAQFRIATQNVAQAATALAAADVGAADISLDLSKLKALASRAATVPLSAAERDAINAEFQAIRARISGVASSTRFNNESLLDGASPQLAVGGQGSKELAIGPMTDEVLFKGANPNLLTAESSKAADALVKDAQAYVEKQRATIKALQDGLDYAANTLEGAIQNRDASNSTLNDADIIDLLLNGGANKNLVTDFPSSLFAQTNKLPANIIQLLGE